MTNKQLEEQLKQLSDFVVKSNKQIEVAEKSINLSMDAAMNNASATELKHIQNQIIDVKILLNKAKSGKEVEAQIETITKNIKNAGLYKR